MATPLTTTETAQTSPVTNGKDETKKTNKPENSCLKDFANLKYLRGFGAETASEALEGALPYAQATPQKCAYGLIAEQLSGTSFTTPRVANQKIWFYRIKPTCVHKPFAAYKQPLLTNDFTNAHINPNQLRWKPYPLPEEKKEVDFVDGLATLGGSGSVDAKSGFAIHIYACNASMKDKSFMNADGDLLIVPQLGTLYIQTECGRMVAPPGHIAVVQRGIRFSVFVEGTSRGYICEVYTGHFKLPELGPIGANGLATPRDFKLPTAAFEDRACDYLLVQKFLGKTFSAHQSHSPYDVVAWHGNYVPYVYDLADFIVINSVSVDHLDPSIFTVLTCPTNEPGVATCDFVIFPPRWCVQEKTFRPPYYHRNCMTEFMGNIHGKYEAKPEGFLPGAGSLHSCMSGHGPDDQSFTKASSADLQPSYLKDTLSFMFESTYIMKLTDWAMNVAELDADYYKCWENIPKQFNDKFKPSPAEARQPSS